MNEAAINERISYYLTLAGFWDTHCRRCHWTFRIDGEGCRPDGYCSFVGELPKQADYFHSEEANARLLEAMVVEKPVILTRWVSGNPPLYTCSVSNVDEGEYATIHYASGIDRKTVIVLAFCKFAGIEVEWTK